MDNSLQYSIIGSLWMAIEVWSPWILWISISKLNFKKYFKQYARPSSPSKGHQDPEKVALEAVADIDGL